MQQSFMPDEAETAASSAKKTRRVSLWYRDPNPVFARWGGWNRFRKYASAEVAQSVVEKKLHDIYWGRMEWHIGDHPNDA